MGALAIVVPASSPPDVETARRMLRAAPHRGEQLDVRVCGSTVLGVSSNDEVPDAWIAQTNGTTAAFAGRLDNAAELSAELGRSGVPVAGEDPASIVSAAFAAWGDRALPRLRGAFTGAVTDGTRVRCFKDQLGLRPLFFRDNGHGFLAATEAKQVLAGAGLRREVDLDAIEDSYYGRNSEARPPIKGVRRFPRASVARVERSGRPSFDRYWDPRALLETERLRSDEVVERLRELLELAVRRAVTGRDVISLSGGIDSPTIAALAAPLHLERTGRRLPALSSIYPDFPTVDESTYIDAVADYLDLPLHTYVTDARPLDDVEFWCDLADAPVDTLSLPELAENYRRARALEARNVLTGEMAEWVFTFGEHLIGHLVLNGRWRAVEHWLREQRRNGTSWRTIARFAAPSLTPSFVAKAYLRFTDRIPLLAPWIDANQLAPIEIRVDLTRPARRRWLEHQLDPLLTPAPPSFDADEICAAWCGVQVQRPLADIDLWEFMLSLPAEAKFPNSVSKALIRDTMRGLLPDLILDRRDKTGFSAHALGTADYAGLERWLANPSFALNGIDYTLLRERIEQRDLDLVELMSAYDLARVHAFVETVS